MSQQTHTPAIQPGQSLAKEGLKPLLESYAPQPDDTASSVYIRPGEVQSLLDASGPEGRTWREHLHQLQPLLLTSDTGIIGFQSGCRGLIILPPFPVQESGLYPSWQVSPLLALLEAEYTVGVVLLRLGRFSVAVFEGKRLLSSKTDARYVKGRHQAGGTSQKRFQRIREGQVRRLYDKTCEAVHTQFAVFGQQLDYVLLGGEKFTLDGFLKVCSGVEPWRSKILSRRLNIRDPKRDTLRQVALMLNESRLYPIEW
jgi:hypothetical protein